MKRITPQAELVKVAKLAGYELGTLLVGIALSIAGLI